MNKIKLPGILILTSFLLYTTCTENPLDVGFELLPSTDLLGTFSDTLSVKGFTVKGFPGVSYNYVGSNSNLSGDVSTIGNVLDPIFGQTQAEATMKILYKSSYSLDTNVLSAAYKSCKLYLHINEELTFGGEGGFDVIMHPLTNNISHQNNTEYAVKSDDFDVNTIVSTSTEHKVYINNNDIPELDSGNYYLVVELDEAYASRFMDTAYINKNNLYRTSTSFLEQIPGYYLRTQATNSTGGLEQFYFNSSVMILEYDWETLYSDVNGGDSIVTETEYSTFSINAYQSLYKHTSNFSPEGPFGSILGDTLNESNQFYIQALGGVRGFIEIPGLDSLKTKMADSIGINYAELVLPVNKALCDTVGFYLPKRISLQNYYPGIKYGDPVIDDNSSSNQYSAYYSGYLNTETMEYRVNITEYVHRVIHYGYYRNKLFVLPSKLNLNTFSSIDYKSPSRAIIQTGNSTNAAYIRIIYTNTNY